MTHVLIRRSERQAYWLHNPAQHRTERVLGRGFFGFAIFAICLSMSWGAIRLIAFGTLLRPGVSGLDQETRTGGRWLRCQFQASRAAPRSSLTYKVHPRRKK